MPRGSKTKVPNGQYPDKTFSAPGNVKSHPNYTETDYSYLRGKGWNDAKILKRWNEESGKGGKGVEWKKPTKNPYSNGCSKAMAEIQNKLKGTGLKLENAAEGVKSFDVKTEGGKSFVLVTFIDGSSVKSPNTKHPGDAADKKRKAENLYAGLKNKDINSLKQQFAKYGYK